MHDKLNLKVNESKTRDWPYFFFSLIDKLLKKLMTIKYFSIRFTLKSVNGKCDRDKYIS